MMTALTLEVFRAELQSFADNLLQSLLAELPKLAFHDLVIRQATPNEGVQFQSVMTTERSESAIAPIPEIGRSEWSSHRSSFTNWQRLDSIGSEPGSPGGNRAGVGKKNMKRFRSYYPMEPSMKLSLPQASTEPLEVVTDRSTNSHGSQKGRENVPLMEGNETVVSRLNSHAIGNDLETPTTIQEIVNSTYFNYGSCVLVLLNACVIGVAADHKVQQRSDETPFIFDASEAFFCFMFTVELLMRIVAEGSDFFSTRNSPWNIFDFFVATIQVVDFASRFVSRSGYLHGISVLRMLRLLRLIRIIRLARILRMITELRAIAASILGSLQSLCWTMALLLFLMYGFGVCITEVVAEHLVYSPDDEGHDKELTYYYGTLSRTVLSLFESIASGQSWDCMLEPLVEEISPLMAPLFCLYVSFVMFAIMNSVTAVFCEKALQNVQDDSEAMLANQVKDALERDVLQQRRATLGTSCNTQITMQDFASLLESPEMREYFKAVDVSISDADSFFELLDPFQMGAVDFQDFMGGIAKFQGPAKALDLALLMNEVDKSHQHIEGQLRKIMDAVSP